eukprot:8748-Heterococcus_DN1.PRE.4
MSRKIDTARLREFYFRFNKCHVPAPISRTTPLQMQLLIDSFVQSHRVSTTLDFHTVPPVPSMPIRSCSMTTEGANNNPKCSSKARLAALNSANSVSSQPCSSTSSASESLLLSPISLFEDLEQLAAEALPLLHASSIMGYLLRLLHHTAFAFVGQTSGSVRAPQGTRQILCA